jgi:hypothetical protein
MSAKVTRLRRVVFSEPIEPPGPKKDIVESRTDVLHRFPRQPGREPKNTPYDLALDPGRPGFVVVRHPTSGLEHYIPASKAITCVPFDAEDEARVEAELEEATAPASPAAKAAAAS